MKKNAVIRVGILFITAVVVIFWGLNYLKGRNFLRQEKAFYAEYTRIGNLVESSPVTINGFQVGQVRSIRLSDTQRGKISVKMILTYPGIELPKGTVALIYSTDLMGTKGIALEPGTDTLMHLYGDTLTGRVEDDLRDQVNAQMVPLKIKAEGLISSMDSVLLAFQLILNEQTRNSLVSSFSSVNSTLGNLESTSDFLEEYLRVESVKISALLSSLDSISNSLQNQTTDLRFFLANLRNFSDTLTQIPIIGAVTSFNQVLGSFDELLQNLNRGEGSLGQLVVSDSLYQSLMATSHSLNRLLEDVRINPRKYVHMSLVDRGKTVLASSDDLVARVLAEEGLLNYYVVVFQSPAPLPPGHQDLAGLGDARFIQVGSLYYYYVYQHQDMDRCMRRMERHRTNQVVAIVSDNQALTLSRQFEKIIPLKIKKM